MPRLTEYRPKSLPEYLARVEGLQGGDVPLDVEKLR
jgi:hypothetical protein